eukprot:TRINITY_DN68436_c0_g1_i1.p1 TRINITY_DN68436_c0_g1~~TRINITY_DN68436_c0_g1_i1.p1  ORF type:complete len:578 (+),score=63.00 TRINITY_DN68436_c0_g1_i1:34-1767(+)
MERKEREELDAQEEQERIIQQLEEQREMECTDYALALHLQEEEQRAQQEEEDCKYAAKLEQAEKERSAEHEQREKEDMELAKKFARAPYAWAKEHRHTTTHPLACSSLDPFTEEDNIQLEMETMHAKESRKAVARDLKKWDTHVARQTTAELAEKTEFGPKHPDKEVRKVPKNVPFSWDAKHISARAPPKTPAGSVPLPFGMKWSSGRTEPKHDWSTDNIKQFRYWTRRGYQLNKGGYAKWVTDQRDGEAMEKLKQRQDAKESQLDWEDEINDEELDTYSKKTLQKMADRKRAALLRRTKELQRERKPPSCVAIPWKKNQKPADKAADALKEVHAKAIKRKTSLRNLQQQLLRQSLPTLTEGLDRYGFAGATFAPVANSVVHKFMSALRRSGEEPEMHFHGTDDSNITKILQQGFQVPGKGNNLKVVNGSVHGVGIYTAREASTSVGYARNHKMLVCAVLPDPGSNDCGWCQVSFSNDLVLPLFIAYWGEEGQKQISHDLSVLESRKFFESGDPEVDADTDTYVGALFSDVVQLECRDKSLLGRITRRRVVSQKERRRKKLLKKKARMPFYTTHSVN